MKKEGSEVWGICWAGCLRKDVTKYAIEMNPLTKRCIPYDDQVIYLKRPYSTGTGKNFDNLPINSSMLHRALSLFVLFRCALLSSWCFLQDGIAPSPVSEE